MTTLLIGLLIGVATGMLVYGVYKIFAEVPEEDRTYLDEPPFLIKVCLPVVNMTAHYMRPFISKTYLDKTLIKLRRGGQDYAINAEQFVASQILSAIAFALGVIFASSILGKVSLGLVILSCLFGAFYPNIWLSERTKKRNVAMLKALPFFLDVLTLSVEAGLNLSHALQQAETNSPPGPLSTEVGRVLRDVRAGRSRIEALKSMAERLDFLPISSFISALVQAELMGSSLGPILRVQAEQRRSERFQRAEKLAMEAPVKMLGPLITCIFPCTFVVIAFPIAVKFLRLGL